MKTTILSVQELIKLGKQLVFGPTLTLIFLIFGKCEIGKLHIFKKFSLSTFEEILQKCVYNSTCMIFSVFLFSLKGYSETLRTAFYTEHLQCLLLNIILVKWNWRHISVLKKEKYDLRLKSNFIQFFFVVQKCYIRAVVLCITRAPSLFCSIGFIQV